MTRIAAGALEVAEQSAARAGVRVTLADHLELLVTVRDVIDAVWRPLPDDRPMTLGVLRAMTHAGNYCSLAWDGDRPVGASVGFLGMVEGRLTLHSHITGVVLEAAGRNVGRALKLHQRWWALQRGVATVTWTYDPLVRRNAYFNAARLGALPTDYLVDFYGDMSDAINVGQHTDRLEVCWELESPAVLEICSGRPVLPAVVAPGTRTVVDLDAVTGAPLVTRAADGPDAAGARLVRVPQDIEAMRRSDPELARTWRLAVREHLGGLMTAGWQVVAVDRAGGYLLTPGRRQPRGHRRRDQRPQEST